MNGNDMAFPVLDRALTPNDTIQLGLTKREYFAALAMQAMCGGIMPTPSDMPEIARRAVAASDALLTALGQDNCKGE